MQPMAMLIAILPHAASLGPSVAAWRRVQLRVPVDCAVLVALAG